MRPILIELSRQRNRFLRRRYRKEKGWRAKRNILVILCAAEGQSSSQAAKHYQLDPSFVWRLKRRFLAEGLRGLHDRRCERGPSKATWKVAEVLADLVRASPLDFGYPRPRWTRALLAEQIHTQTGVVLSVTSVGRLLARIGSRWNRARPVVKCPWPEDKRIQRLQQISNMLARLPPDEVALFEDEVDIHLNPKIGFDWMMRGEQKQILTPGQNVKRYLAGAIQVASKQVVWVRGERKDSALFVSLLRALVSRYAAFKRIHLILDNYCIHKSKTTCMELQRLQEKIQLHFLPPYCPKANKMELVWLHLHENVTCNHRCQSIEELLSNAENDLTSRYNAPPAHYRLAA